MAGKGKPFDLKAALEGQLIQWNTGFDGVRQYKFLQLEYISVKPTLRFKRTDGSGYYLTTNLDGVPQGGFPVTMVPRKVKKTVYVNFYPDYPAVPGAGYAYYRDTAEDARSVTRANAIAVAVPVEIEIDEE